MKNKIAIIGGGSLGLFLASLLSEEDLDVCVYEKNNKLGKKILASGNGKCNFTNISPLNDKYNNLFANQIIAKYNVCETLARFKELGLIFKNDDQGRCYPVSECATSVLDCLKKKLNKVRICLDSEVKSIIRQGTGYIVNYNSTNEYFDYVVCSSGSVASNLGSYKAYSYLSELNIGMSELKSSLAPVIVKENVSMLKGVRVKCFVKLTNEINEVVYQEDGEILFKEDSLSGIAVFNISSFLNRNKGNYKIVLDLSAGMNDEYLFSYIMNRRQEGVNLFKGYLNDKISEYIFKNLNVKVVDENVAKKLICCIKELTFHVKGIYPISEGQVCSGGVLLSEVNDNLELKKYPNVYVGGELLDIDGISGGYNLQFAWSSAGVIANDIKNKIGEFDEKKEEK